MNKDAAETLIRKTDLWKDNYEPKNILDEIDLLKESVEKSVESRNYQEPIDICANLLIGLVTTEAIEMFLDVDADELQSVFENNEEENKE